eukprot:scaffold1130_cov195-Pinguiococcus_pyrenoidosus.AAC.63
MAREGEKHLATVALLEPQTAVRALVVRHPLALIGDAHGYVVVACQSQIPREQLRVNDTEHRRIDVGVEEDIPHRLRREEATARVVAIDRIMAEEALCQKHQGIRQILHELRHNVAPGQRLRMGLELPLRGVALDAQWVGQAGLPGVASLEILVPVADASQALDVDPLQRQALVRVGHQDKVDGLVDRREWRRSKLRRKVSHGPEAVDDALAVPDGGGRGSHNMTTVQIGVLAQFGQHLEQARAVGDAHPQMREGALGRFGPELQELVLIGRRCEAPDALAPQVAHAGYSIERHGHGAAGPLRISHVCQAGSVEGEGGVAHVGVQPDDHLVLVPSGFPPQRLEEVCRPEATQRLVVDHRCQVTDVGVGVPQLLRRCLCRRAASHTHDGRQRSRRSYRYRRWTRPTPRASAAIGSAAPSPRSCRCGPPPTVASRSACHRYRRWAAPASALSTPVRSIRPGSLPGTMLAPMAECLERHGQVRDGRRGIGGVAVEVVAQQILVVMHRGDPKLDSVSGVEEAGKAGVRRQQRLAFQRVQLQRLVQASPHLRLRQPRPRSPRAEVLASHLDGLAQQLVALMVSRERRRHVDTSATQDLLRHAQQPR